MESAGSTYGNTGSTQSASGAGTPGQPVVEQAKQQATAVIDQAREQVRTRLSEQKDTAASSLGTVAQALHRTAQELEGEQTGPLGDYAHRAADQVERLSGYLQQHDLSDLQREAEYFARRRPALFLGGAFVLGLMAARFMKSSSERDYPYGSANATEALAPYSMGYGATTGSGSGHSTTHSEVRAGDVG
jgi:hypothetical protein